MTEEFRKLTEQEIQELLRQVRHDQSIISFKFPDQPVFKAKASQAVWQKYLSCTEPPGMPKKINWENLAAINIIVGDDLYFFKAKVTRDKRSLHITMPKDILYLQRRKKRRVKIPADFPAFYLIRGDNDTGLLKCVVMDISNEGVKAGLAVDNPKLSIGDILNGDLCLGELDAQKVNVVVRHHKNLSTGEYKQVFGLEFADPPADTQANIEKVVLDLQREFFLRMLD